MEIAAANKVNSKNIMIFSGIFFRYNFKNNASFLILIPTCALRRALYSIIEYAFYSTLSDMPTQPAQTINESVQGRKNRASDSSRNDLVSLRLGTKRGCLHTLFPTLEKLHSFHTFSLICPWSVCNECTSPFPAFCT